MDTAFLILSKLVRLGLMVETWLALGLATGVWAAARGRARLARLLCSAMLIALVSVAALPLGDLLLRPLEAEYPPRAAPDQIHGIVVLGGVEEPHTSSAWGTPQVNDAAERLTSAAALARAYPEARVVFSGGTSGGPDAPSVAVDLLVSLGVQPARITWERQSRNTSENARRSFEVVRPAPGQTWLLVTSAFHMGRALASFEAAGWPAMTPHPVDYRTGAFAFGIGWNLADNAKKLNLATKEWLGRLVYGVTGR